MGTSLQHKFAERKGGTIVGGLFNSLVAQVRRLPKFLEKRKLIADIQQLLSSIQEPPPNFVTSDEP